MLSDERVKEFMVQYAKGYGEVISQEKARAMLTRLVGLYKLLLRRLPHERPREE